MNAPSLRGAINAYCRECIYDHLGGGTCRQQIIKCTILKCPLYPVRPGAAKPERTYSEAQLAAQQKLIEQGRQNARKAPVCLQESAILGTTPSGEVLVSPADEKANARVVCKQEVAA
jgi:hypothetical protein